MHRFLRYGLGGSYIYIYIYIVSLYIYIIWVEFIRILGVEITDDLARELQSEVQDLYSPLMAGRT